MNKGLKLALDPERERAVRQIADFAILAHARIVEQHREAADAQERLRESGVDVRFHKGKP